MFARRQRLGAAQLEPPWACAGRQQLVAGPLRQGAGTAAMRQVSRRAQNFARLSAPATAAQCRSERCQRLRVFEPSGRTAENLNRLTQVIEPVFALEHPQDPQRAPYGSRCAETPCQGELLLGERDGSVPLETVECLGLE